MKTIRDGFGKLREVHDDGFLINPILVVGDLGEIIDSDLEGFLDIISEAAGFPLMTEVTWTVVGHTAAGVKLAVSGNVSEHIHNTEL